MLDNIRIVLINTFHPGNIGAAARAMKNMGLSQLYLVAPKQYPHPEADARAAGASDVLAQAVVVERLEDAIGDCGLVIGTSARSRTFSWPMLDARTCGEKAVQEAQSAPVAIVFGRETMGLHNDELMQCNYHVAIPGNPEYPVLNVSAAVQVIAYEIWQHHSQADQPEPPITYPRQGEMKLFYEHLEQALLDINFIVRQHPGRVMTKLHRFFNRARPEKVELNILRGILAAMQRCAEQSQDKKEN